MPKRTQHRTMLRNVVARRRQQQLTRPGQQQQLSCGKRAGKR